MDVVSGMGKLYARLIGSWETRLAFRATNRVVREFEWGLEWARDWPVSSAYPQNGYAPYEYLRKLNELAAANSDGFYAYQPPRDFELDGGMLRFTSPVRTPYPENNRVHAQWFPAKNSAKAVVVLPHWNAPATGHNALCRGLQRLGISALRISLPYHDYRMPAELQRADYAVSSNIGRTVDAARQAVIDVRCCADWLEQQGAQRLGIVGTSLGSCYACLASAHDARIRVNVFNHCSTYFSDVVWAGLSTQHIRKSLDGKITLEQLRECWRAISPVTYMQKFAASGSKSLFIYTTYDTTFPPHLSEDAIAMVRQHGADHKVIVLPCGHYTMGEAPFKFIDGYQICAYLKRTL